MFNKIAFSILSPFIALVAAQSRLDMAEKAELMNSGFTTEEIAVVERAAPTIVGSFVIRRLKKALGIK